MKRKKHRLKKRPSKFQLLAILTILIASLSGLLYGNADQTVRSNQTAPGVYSDKSTDVVDFSPQANPQAPASTNSSLQSSTSSPTGAVPDEPMVYDPPPYCKPGLNAKVVCYRLYCKLTADCRLPTD